MNNPPYFPLTGAALLAQYEHESNLLQKLGACNNCLKPGSDASLRRCTGCHLAAYCSKECQKQHWPRHKTFCNLVQAKGKKKAYLSGMEREDCFRQLIDSYRLRVEDDHTHRHEDHGVYYVGKLIEGLVWANGDVYDDFQLYLDLAESSGILPDWWSFEGRMECLASAVDQDVTGNVLTKADQAAIIHRYGGDATIRNTLRILAELIVGYDGKGRVEDDDWFHEFSESLKAPREEKQRLVQALSG